jgi:acyl-protein synthetase LuxE
VSALLDRHPYGECDERAFVTELRALTQHHLAGCAEYARIWPNWKDSADVASFPFLHVGAFKAIQFVTSGCGIRHQRVLRSSATLSGIASQIMLDQRSVELQSRSSNAILVDFLGTERRPLLVLDSVAGLRSGAELSARTAAALSLKPLSSDIIFLLRDVSEPASAKWDQLLGVLGKHDSFFVYGFTSMLWSAWACAEMPLEVRSALRGKRIDFVHSGGWKKLEHLRVGREQFDKALTHGLDPRSRVLDFYGLVEQVGLVYPLCSMGFRHVPIWADVLVRDPWTLAPLADSEGQLQLINLLAWGAPYHNVLTEDLGRLVPGECPCGRTGKRFEFTRRMPKAEMRGCANV